MRAATAACIRRGRCLCTRLRVVSLGLQSSCAVPVGGVFQGGEEEDEDNEETARGSQAAGGKAAGAEAAGRPRYITPTEVMEIMRRMWAVNGDILSYIFSSPKANRGRPQNAPAHRDTYKMFFLQTVAVAPNKFRPASRVGDQV